MKTSSTSSSACFALLLLVCFIFYACTKPYPDNLQSTNQFQWTHKGVTHNTVYDTAYLNSHGLSIPAFSIVAGDLRINSIAPKVAFYLTAFNVGTFNIGPYATAANKLYFIDNAGFNLDAVSGNVNITTYYNSRITGNFSITVIDGSAVTSQLTGSFTDMPVVF
jgi:hypothetical protein